MRTFRVALLCMLMGTLLMAAVAQADPPEGEEADLVKPPRVHVKRTEPRTLATMSHEGSFNAIPQVIRILTETMEGDSRLQAGPIMIVYFNDPQEVEEKDLLWEVWIPVVNPGTFGKSGHNTIAFKYLDAMFVAYTYHIGPVETVGTTFETLFDWATRNRYEIIGAPMEVYWSDPDVTPPDKQVIELWLPIDEKKIPDAVR